MLLIRLASLVLAAALAAGPAKAELEHLLRSQWALPSLVGVEGFGRNALHPYLRSQDDPRYAIERSDLYIATAHQVDAMAARPIEEAMALARYDLYRLAEALAHQWGRARILVDHLERLDAALAAGGGLDRDAVPYRILRSLRSASHGVDDAAPDKYQRLAAAVRLSHRDSYASATVATGTTPLQFSSLFDDLYAAAGRADVATTRAAIHRARGRLQERIDFVLDYSGRLLDRAGSRLRSTAAMMLDSARRGDRRLVPVPRPSRRGGSGLPAERGAP